MILEVVILDVISGREQEFETGFREASRIIASMAGYSSHQLQRCLEKQNRYLLLVQWETLEAHTLDFAAQTNIRNGKSNSIIFMIPSRLLSIMK